MNKIFAGIAVALTAAGSSAEAQSVWSGSVSGNWFTGSNWLPTTAPGAGSTVQIDTNGLANAPTIGSAGASAFIVSLGANAGRTGELSITGPGTLTVSSGASGYFAVGDVGTGVLNITSGGSLSTTTYTVIGNYAGSSGTATVSGANSTWTVGFPYFSVGESGTGTLNIENGGTVTSAFTLEIGNDNLAVGRVNMSGTDSRLIMGSISVGDALGSRGMLVVSGGTVRSGAISVGTSGSGSLVIQSGATGTATSLTVGSSGTGTATIDGAGTALNAGTEVTVGLSTSGSLTISGSALVTSGAGRIGVNSGGRGTVLVTGTGSRWTTVALTLGQAGANTGTAALLVANGGTVSATSLTGHNSATLNISGSNSRLSVAGQFALGATGTNNRIDVVNGAAFNAGTVSLTSSATSRVQAVVSGTGSSWVSGTTTIGGSGTSSLTFTNSATASVGGDFIVDGSGSSELLISSGAYVTYNSGSSGLNQFRLGVDNHGSLRIDSGGTMEIVNSGTLAAFMYFGRNEGSSATAVITGPGSKLITRGIFTAGSSGSATMDILDGGTLTGDQGASIATGTNSVSVVTVSGTGSNWTMSEAAPLTGISSITVGGGGNGTLNVTSGGTVTAQGLFVGRSFFVFGEGYHAGTGHVLVSGTGSAINLDLTSFQFLSIGGAGAEGVVDVENGGTVTVIGSGVIGDSVLPGGSQPARGTLNISGPGSQVSLTQSLVIGEQSIGVVNLQNGGLLINDDAEIGSMTSGSPVGSGTVTVNSARWTNNGTLAVGAEGIGTLRITSSGTVTSAHSVIGRSAGSSGTARVAGAGSVWATTGSLAIGRTGTGALTIADGGAVSAGGPVSINAISVLNIGEGASAGTLIASTVANNGLIRFDHTGTTTFSAAVSGTGAIYKDGAGATILSGSNTYSGGTTIEAGTLIVTPQVAGVSALGTGPVEVGIGGTLAGNGLVLGDTTIAGQLSPGNSTGQLAFGGNLLMESTAVITMELASLVDFDSISVGGTLSYDGTLSLILTGGYIPGVGEEFALFDLTIYDLGTEFDDITFNVAGVDATMNYETGVLTIVSVPEPGTTALAAAAATLLLSSRRRRRAFPPVA